MVESIDLDFRAQQVLKQLIHSYTENAQPVGSKSLAEISGLDVSSATIRNIMARLEELGLIDSPHTSAGRIPTQAGYRFYIDSLLEVQDIAKTTTKTISEILTPYKTSSDLIQSASSLLSNVTKLTGLVSLNKPAQSIINHIEFMRLSERRILVILVMNQDDVHNKVIQVDREYTDIELTQTAQTLSQYLIGRNFSSARKDITRELLDIKSDVQTMMQSVVDVMDTVCEDAEHEDLMTAGEANLFQFTELSDVNKLRELFEVFQQKKDLLHLLDGCSQADGVEIFIGSESGYSVLRDCSVIGAPYQIGNQVVGVLGVIGPTRIDYEKVIPVVDITAKLLSSALNLPK